jgi:hypothetical protein
MKIYFQKFTMALVAGLAVLGLSATAQAGPDADQLKSDAKAALQKTEDTAKDLAAKGKDLAQKGADQAAKVGTNVLAKVKEGAHKTENVVSNVVIKVETKVQALTK